MEPLTLFAATVGFISAFHLIATTANRLGKGIHNSGNAQQKREDWYCFFQPSDLTGLESVDNTTVRKSHRTHDRHLEQRRRQQMNRPRLQM